MEEPNKLYLDYSIWRCGGDSGHPEASLGNGYTRLLNKEGFACCLGQFSVQLNRDITKDDLLELPSPVQLANYKHKKADLFISVINKIPMNSDLASIAMKINDNPISKVEDKILDLQRLFATVNVEIEVLNKP